MSANTAVNALLEADTIVLETLVDTAAPSPISD